MVGDYRSAPLPPPSPLPPPIPASNTAFSLRPTLAELVSFSFLRFKRNRDIFLFGIRREIVDIPSFRGGDEGRVARTGSGRFGASPRGGPQRSCGAGRPVRTTPVTYPASPISRSRTSTTPLSQSSSSLSHTSPSVFVNSNEQWARNGTGTTGTTIRESTSPPPPPPPQLSPSLLSSSRRTSSGNQEYNSYRHRTDVVVTPEIRWQDRLELRGVQVVPMSRPPSSSSSSSSSSTTLNNPTSTLPRVHGHDHNRPLPPPRLQQYDVSNTTSQNVTGTAAATTTTTTMTISSSSVVAPLTAPLTPLSTNSTTTGFVRTSSRAPAPVPVHDVVRIQTSQTDHHLNQEQHIQNLQVQNSSLRNQSSIINPVSEVTLTVPRPDGERAVNEYVETPFRPNIVTSSKKCVKSDRTKRQQHHHHHHHIHHRHHNNQSNNTTGRGVNNTTTNRHNSAVPSSSPNKNHVTITKQPVSFTKEPTNSVGSPGSQLAQQIQMQQQQQQLQQRSNLFSGLGSGGGVGGGTGNVGGVIIPLDEGLSIMCEYCGRCRCESCREPPPLPSRWLCDNACFCSAETALDYASCLCCVKGLFYHCGDATGNGVDSDGEGAGSCADEPCSCNGSRRLARWTCLGALALALPCLLCYWPLKGCVALCEACYARHASHGCRCDPSTAGRHLATSTLRDSRDPEKRLLDPVTPEL